MSSKRYKEMETVSLGPFLTNYMVFHLIIQEIKIITHKFANCAWTI